MRAKKIMTQAAASAAAPSKVRVDAVMQAAKRSGLLGERTARIGVRVSPELVRQAKKQTGIEADSELVAFALASVALQDDFPKVFKELRGKVPKDIKLGY